MSSRPASIDQPLQVLALKPAFGSVATSRDGRIRVAVGDAVLELAESDYWVLMEMLSEASRRLASTDTPMRDDRLVG